MLSLQLLLYPLHPHFVCLSITSSCVSSIEYPKKHIYIYLYIYMYILIHKEKHINKIHFPSSISCYISNERSTSPCLCLQRFFMCFSLGWCEGDLLSLFKYSVCSCLNFSASHSHHSGIYIYMYITLNIHIYIYTFMYIYIYLNTFMYIYIFI